MSDKRKPKSDAPAPKRAPKTKKAKAAAKKPGEKTRKTKAKTVAASAPKRASKTRRTIGKAKEPGAKTRKPKAEPGGEAKYRIGDPVLDPIGDVSSGEARSYLGDAEPAAQAEMEAYRAETAIAAMDAGLEAGPGLEAIQAAIEGRARKAAEDASALEAGAEASGAAKSGQEPHEPRKLERLQKILSQSGIASRRRAEEMIVAGRVMVNGQVVTQLGSKADATRDHIRVDGKLLQGAERHRYFVLNKPRGYVTTVSDPEGRPAVMQFFAKMHERLYPVGRLDYQSEGLLLMTNDGELVNLLTKAGSGVEKTYLVKVAGQPSEEQLERLRGGVAIERGDAGSARVRTALARIRRVREGDNPWYEVVLTEGRNRELRKMFAAIGHFAEKIRRVGYGPLVLDVEPGKLRELTADEVNALRLTAEGKMKPRRVHADRMLPKEAGQAAEKRDRSAGRRDGGNQRFDRVERREEKHGGRGERRDTFAGQRFGGPRPDAQKQGEKPRWQRKERGAKKEWQPREFNSVGRRQEFGGGKRRGFGGERREFRGGPRTNPGLKSETWGTRRDRFDGGERRTVQGRGERPEWKRSEGPQFERGGEGKKRFGGERSHPSGKNKDAARMGHPGQGFQKGAHTGGVGKFRDEGGRGRRFGGSRPGAARGGWKRG
ncbi:MAG: pseudouridine synthase [Terracidiphilus sp.]